MALMQHQCNEVTCLINLICRPGVLVVKALDYNEQTGPCKHGRRLQNISEVHPCSTIIKTNISDLHILLFCLECLSPVLCFTFFCRRKRQPKFDLGLLQGLICLCWPTQQSVYLKNFIYLPTASKGITKDSGQTSVGTLTSSLENVQNRSAGFVLSNYCCTASYFHETSHQFVWPCSVQIAIRDDDDGLRKCDGIWRYGLTLTNLRVLLLKISHTLRTAVMV